MKKLMSFIIVFLFLIASFVVPVNAESGNLVDDDIRQWQVTKTDDIDYLIYSNYRAKDENGYYRIALDVGDIGEAVLFYDITDLVNSHNYKFTGKIYSQSPSNNALTYFLSVIVVYDNKSPSESLDADFIELYDNTDWVDEIINVDKQFTINVSRPYKAYMALYAYSITDVVTTRNIYVKDFKLVDLDDNTGFFESIKDWMSALYHSIVGGIDSKGVSHDSLWSKIGAYVQDLGTSISGFFVDLKNNLQVRFSDLSDSISGFFATLKNYILYFSADGEYYYTNPYEETNEQFLSVVGQWVINLKSFSESVKDSGSTFSTYIENITSLSNGLVSAVPILGALLSFGAIFVVVRKIVGR